MAVVQAPMTTAGAAPSAFVWGSNGQMLTPDQVASQRQIAQAMMANAAAPHSLGEGLSAIGKALIARGMVDQADTSQKSGMASAADAFAGLGPDPSLGALESTVANPYLNEGQSSVVKAMLQQKLAQSDPKYLADLGLTQAQTNAINAKPALPLQVVPRNSSVYDPNSDKTVFSAPNDGGFDGNSDTATAQRIIMTGDPSSKEYAIAYQQLYGPKTQQQQTATGIVTFNIQNPPPAGVAPPTFGATAAPAVPAAVATPDTSSTPSPTAGVAPPFSPAPASASLAPAAPSPAAVASVQDMSQAEQAFSPNAPPVVPQPANVVPGTAPYNESQSRLNYLAQSATPDLQRVITGFPALTQTLGQLADKDPTGLTNGLKSPEYQQASTAVRSAMGNIMYFVSGAAQGNVEVERKLNSYMPAFGDHPATIADKLSRFSNDVMDLARTSKDPQTIAWAQQATAGLEDTMNQISPGSAPAKISSDAEYNALPSGAVFRAPDGSTRKKP